MVLSLGNTKAKSELTFTANDLDTAERISGPQSLLIGWQRRSLWARDLYAMIVIVLALLDLAGIAGSAALCRLLYPPPLPEISLWRPSVMGVLLAMLYAYNVGAYSHHKFRKVEWRPNRVLAAWTLSVITLLLAEVPTNLTPTITWIYIWWLMASGFILIIRGIAAAVINIYCSDDLVWRVAVVGVNLDASSLLEALQSERGCSTFRAVAIANVADIDARCEELASIARARLIDEIIVLLEQDATCHQALISKLSEIPVDVTAYRNLGVELQDILPPGRQLQPLLQRPIGGVGWWFKRFMDLVLGIALLIFFSPVLLLTAIAISLDSPGPIFFRQVRQGFCRQPFTVFKFRSMVIIAAKDSTVRQATRFDARVTRVGRFIRSTSLDSYRNF